MKLVAVYLVWFIIAAILVAGIVLAAKGSLWLFALGMLGFLGALREIRLPHPLTGRFRLSPPPLAPAVSIRRL